MDYKRVIQGERRRNYEIVNLYYLLIYEEVQRSRTKVRIRKKIVEYKQVEQGR